MSSGSREAHAIERIGEIIRKLDETCESIESAEGKVKCFFEQEKTIHEILYLIREVKKASCLDERAKRYMENKPNLDIFRESNALTEIAWRFDRLEIVIGKLDDTDYKVKGYYEQRKELHEVKRILHYMGKYDKYCEKELENICC